MTKEQKRASIVEKLYNSIKLGVSIKARFWKDEEKHTKAYLKLGYSMEQLNSDLISHIERMREVA